ncbi:MAG: hypothetical protein SFY70_12655 [Bacteroidia bacterium]|nr:hypothetical protein [Bacteroidia bacterium]
MLRRTVKLLRGVVLSMPLQLLRSQLSHHKGLLVFWLFIYLVVTDNLLSGFGGPALFLEPEYHNQFGALSMFLVGLGFGLFVLAYQLACFILDGYRFLFIVYQRRPFRLFALNNSLLPLLFVGLYISGFVRFHLRHNAPTAWEITGWLTALFAGQMLVLGFSTVYFWLLARGFTRRLTDRVTESLRGAAPRLVRRIALTEERTLRVEWYVTLRFGLQRAINTFRGSTLNHQRLLARHHGVALAVMAFYLVALVIVGLDYDNPRYHLPAAASMLIFLSLLMMVVGAISYWFRQLGLALVALLVLGAWYLNQPTDRAGTHPVFGLDYQAPPAPYTHTRLSNLAGPDTVAIDRIATLQALERWRHEVSPEPGTKPRLVLLTTSGGGLRAARWTVTALQALDSATQGQFQRHLRLITGASGGMIGAGYWRELHYRALTDSAFAAPHGVEQQERISRDLFNRLVFFGLINLFSPTGTYTWAGQPYTRDRGYAFEEQLIANTGAFAGRRQADYRTLVAAGRLPMMAFSPAIVNDGRQLLVAELPASYLCAPLGLGPLYTNELPAVELRRLVGPAQADALRFTSLLRMNASFPYVLPFAELPTDPRTEVLDAGVIDNFGTTLAVRFLFTFRDWISRNTSGVLIVQVRDTRRVQQDLSLPDPSPVQRALSVFGSTYNSLSESRDFQNDDLLAHASTWLSCPFEVLDLQYIPHPSFSGAALNFHLTAREKRDIGEAIDNPENQAALQRVARLLRRN